MKKIGRGKANCIGKTSKFVTWLAATITAPSSGKFSSPRTSIRMSNRKTRANSQTANLRRGVA